MLDRVNPDLQFKVRAAPEQTNPELPAYPTNSTHSQYYVPSLSRVVEHARRVLFSLWALLALLAAVLAVLVAYQFTPALLIKLGGGYDRPFLNQAEGGFGYAVRFDYDDGQSLLAGSEAEAGGQQNNTAPSANTPATGPEAVRENYRWTHVRPILLLPGLGEPANLEFRAAASPVYPDGQKVQVLLNGRDFSSFNLKPGSPSTHSFNLSGAEYPRQNGNLAVELRVTPSGPSDPKINAPKDGFKLYSVRVTPQPSGLLPPFGITLFLALATLGLYFALAYVGLAQKLACGGAALLAGLAGAVLATYRLEFTSFAGRLALLLVLAALALPLLDLGLPRLFHRLGVPLSRRTWTILLVLFLAGLLLRGGGVLYPQTVIIDAPAHLLEINKVTHGQLMQEYFNRDLSKVPGQWNSAAIIPYSTISYFLLAPFALLPLDPAISVNLVNVLLDALRVFVIFGLAVGLGFGSRGAVLGAGLYLLVPSTWLMNSWGNWPTTLSFWLAVLYLTLALLLWKRLGSGRVWLGLTALLTVTMMAYSVTAVFMVGLLYFWAGGLFLFPRASRISNPSGLYEREERRRAGLIAASATAAALAAAALYYWQFLPDLATTLNSFDQSLGSGEGLGLGRRDFFPYLLLYTDHLFNIYGVGTLLTLALAVSGTAFFAPSRKLVDLPGSLAAFGTFKQKRNLWFTGGWIAVFVLFGLAQWKIDMVDKQVWFIVPLVCVLSSSALLFLWEQARRPLLLYGGRLVVLGLTGWLTYSSVSLWIYRIFFKRH